MTDDEARALIEQADLLQSLCGHPGWPVLVDFLETWMRSDKRAVLNGDVDDHDTYLKRTWFFRGAHFAIDAPKIVDDRAVAARKQLAGS